ncbi:MAG: Rab family GTPase [Candidatus Acidiferrales bacterium]|jgi:small GTP-binding protein
MLGSFSVGKSSLVRRFVSTIFDDTYLTTIGVKIEKKVVKAASEEVMLVMWDIHGDDIYQHVPMNYLRGMSGYLLVIDGTRRQTLIDALSLAERVTKEIGRVPALLVLNKCDLMDQWEIDDGQQSKLKKDGWIVVTTSAKTGDGVEKAFLQLAEAMVAAK